MIRPITKNIHITLTADNFKDLVSGKVVEIQNTRSNLDISISLQNIGFDNMFNAIDDAMLSANGNCEVVERSITIDSIPIAIKDKY